MDLPADAHRLSETSVVDEWVNRGRHWMIGGFIAVILWIPIWIDSMIRENIVAGLLFSIIAAIIGIGYAVWATNSQRSQLGIIAVQEGHPWHDSDAQTGTAVFVSGSDDEWISIPTNTRLHLTRDPLLGGLQLRDGDADDNIIVRWSREMNDEKASKLASLINMAQALSEAQNRDIDEDDPIEEARERETSGDEGDGDDESDLLTRQWLDTTPGQIEVPLGALIRKVTGSKQSDGESLRTIGKPEENPKSE